jgi:ethanolamine-phosphate cytidylyltransferase
MDGAFDVMHYGHMNAFRLGRSLGTYLIVGVNSDESITQCKGPPIMNDEERMTMVKGCKFVDEVVPNCPYIMTSEYLDYIFTTYDVDYVVHGDDPCIVNGKDVYASAKRRGRYRSIPRTEGVSTTEIVGRMLLMTKHHHMRRHNKTSSRARGNSVGSLSGSMIAAAAAAAGGGGGEHPSIDVVVGENSSDDSDNEIHNENDEDDLSVFTAAQYNDGGERIVIGNQSKFLTTSMMLRLFSAGVKPPEEGMRVTYVDGAWDMFHCGHVKFLEEVSKRGNYLIVGIHGDTLVNKRRGGNLPLMNLHERVLSVLGCKYVNDVLIDAPLAITHDMIVSLKISEVVYGTESDDIGELDERYRYPREMGILTAIKSPLDFKLVNILSRIQKKQAELQSKIERKKKAEREWFNNKYDQNGDGGRSGAAGRGPPGQNGVKK